jgi:hypothetical protein
MFALRSASEICRGSSAGDGGKPAPRPLGVLGSVPASSPVDERLGRAPTGQAIRKTSTDMSSEARRASSRPAGGGRFD